MPRLLRTIAEIPSSMQPSQPASDADRPSTASMAVAAAAAALTIQPSSPRFFFSSATTANTNAGSHRRISVAVNLSDESAYAVKWAVQNYLRSGDAVILLHVCPTSILYGADWGSIDLSVTEEADSEQSQQKLEDNFDNLTTTKVQDHGQ